MKQWGRFIIVRENSLGQTRQAWTSLADREPANRLLRLEHMAGSGGWGGGHDLSWSCEIEGGLVGQAKELACTQ